MCSCASLPRPTGDGDLPTGGEEAVYLPATGPAETDRGADVTRESRLVSHPLDGRRPGG